MDKQINQQADSMSHRIFNLSQLIGIYISINRIFNNNLIMLIFLFAPTILFQIVLSYTEIQGISNTTSFYLALSRNGSKMATLNSDNTFTIYKLVNGFFELTQLFSVSDPRFVQISDDESLIFCSYGNSFKIYQYNHSTNLYEIKQEELATFNRAKISKDLTFIFSTTMSQLIIYQYDGTQYTVSQSIPIAVNAYCLSVTSDNSHVLVGDFGKNVNIFRFNGSEYELSYSFIANAPVYSAYIPDDMSKIIIGGLSSSSIQVYKYQSFSDSYVFHQSYMLQFQSTYSIELVHEKIVVSGNGGTIHIFIEDELSANLLSQQNITISNETIIYQTVFDITNSLMVIPTGNQIYVYYQSNIPHCLNWSIPFQCSTCATDYLLNVGDNLCYLINTTNETNTTNNTNATNVANNTTNNSNSIDNNDQLNLPAFKEESEQGCLVYSSTKGKCEQYCQKSCLFCSKVPSNCTQCSPFYEKQEDGSCKLPQSVFGAKIIYSLASMYNHRKIKSGFFLFDDIALYQYHKNDYKGTVSDIFSFARVIERTKDEFIDLQSLVNLQKLAQSLQNYNQFSNQKYLKIERNNDHFLLNLVDFALQAIPVALLIFLVNNLLFYILFKYPSSIYFRSNSLYGYLFISIIEGNIEYLTFLAMRNFTHLFAERPVDKLYNLLIIVLFFFVVIFTFAGYLLLEYLYKRLFRYFLDNLFRMKRSSWMMMTVYCLRPFLKGCIHSLMYENNEMQLLLLGAVDLLTFVIMIVQQIKSQNYKSEISFIFLAGYIFSGIILNALLFGNIKYRNEVSLFEMIDRGLLLVFCFRVASLILASIFNIAELFQCRKGSRKGYIKEKSGNDKIRQGSENRSCIFDNNLENLHQKSIDSKNLRIQE